MKCVIGGLACLLAVLAGCTHAEAAASPVVATTTGNESHRLPIPSSPREPPSVTTPASRRDRSAPSTEPELALAEARYAQLGVTPLGLALPQPNASTVINVLVAQIRVASEIARQVVEASALATTGATTLRVSALTLQADAYDLLVARMVSMSVPGPLGATPAIQAQFEERIRSAIAPQITPIYCLAVARYQRVLALDPTNARANEQLAAYGDAFVQSCD